MSVQFLISVDSFMIKRYDKINDIYKEQLIPSELGLVIGAITESQKLIDDAIKLEKEGGKMNMCKALRGIRRKRKDRRKKEKERIKGEIKNKILLIRKKIPKRRFYGEGGWIEISWKV